MEKVSANDENGERKDVICSTCNGSAEKDGGKCPDCVGGWAATQDIVHEECGGHGCDKCDRGWITVQVKAVKDDVLSPDMTQGGLKLKTVSGEKKKGKVVLIREEISEALKVALDITSGKSSMPILSHVHLKASGQACLIEVTDLETAWSKTVEATVYGEVDVCIPLVILSKEVAALHADIKSVELSLKDSLIKVNNRCEIYTLPGSEFPVLPNVKGDEVVITGLPVKLKRVLPAVGDNDTRYVLNGVYFDLAQGYLVATDGHRMHLDTIDKTEGAAAVVIPGKPAALMAKYGADILTLSKERVACALSGGVMTARLIEGNYPAYQNVLPSGNPIRATFKGSELLKVLQGAVPIAAGSSKTVKLSFNGQIDVQAVNPDVGQYHYYVPCEKTGEDITVAFNAKYLADAVGAYTTKEQDTVIMELNEPLSPVLVNGLAVIMPMRS